MMDAVMAERLPFVPVAAHLTRSVLSLSFCHLSRMLVSVTRSTTIQ
jgi:hypothetical protein